MGRNGARALLWATVVTGSTGIAFGQPLENIGNAGQIVFGAERLTGVYHDEVTVKQEVPADPTTGRPGVTMESTSKSTTIGVFGQNALTPSLFLNSASSVPRLALDYFVTDGLSVGGSFVFLTRSGVSEIENDPTQQDQPTLSTLVVNPRVGYAYAFDETFGIWPRLGFIYERDWSKSESNGTQSVSRKTSVQYMTIGLDVPFFISPMKHFAILIGPYFDLGVAGNRHTETDAAGAVSTPDSDAKYISYGASTGVVGYF